MERHFDDLNGFLVGLFNDILKIEENALRAGEYREISVRDMHIIEAVCAAGGENDNRTTAVARDLGVTTGTLTVAVNSLVKKGYIERRQDPKDRRVVLLPQRRLCGPIGPMRLFIGIWWRLCFRL